MTATILAAKVALAGASSVLAGGLIWLILTGATRRWPALAAWRPAWLGGQLLAALVCVGTLMPQATMWSVVPAVTLPAPLRPFLATAASTPFAVPMGAVPATPATRLASDPGLAAPTPTGNNAHLGNGALWLDGLALALLCCYPAGLLFSLWRLHRGWQLWRALASGAHLLDHAELLQHAGFGALRVAELERCGVTVRETAAAISPMLAGLRQPCLLLPKHLRRFTVEQQQMIIAHELTHCRRGDPWLQMVALSLQTLFWFNPPLRWLGRQLSWAQEIGCDRQVLTGLAQRQRLSYAAALVQQCRLQRDQHLAGARGLAFGAADRDSIAARVSLMRDNGAGSLSMASKCLLAAVCSAVFAAGIVLQPALAWTVPDVAAPAVATSARLPPAPPAWQPPLARMRVTSFYHVVSNLLPEGHHGIDLAAASGTAIQAVADGSIVEVGHDARRGNFVMIEHAAGRRSLYAHLRSVAVHDGLAVSAGQVIGQVGQTGMATGPHLHLEAYQGNDLIDPQQLLAGLDQHATERALRIRKAQFGH